ncbi:interleukin-5 receptor subunit alpha isoform X2 [Ranitomeya variabilis]|uniref:interleukin-5 receptor subunit alpha isoform X2 n=1 Tax=Ranitomeya variabilis TaxID=490064 RepID=UPI004056E50E
MWGRFTRSGLLLLGSLLPEPPHTDVSRTWATCTLFLLLYSRAGCRILRVTGDVEPPQDLNIAVPKLGRVVLSWKHSVTPPNTTVKYVVKIHTPEKTINIKTSNNFSAQNLELHQGLTAQVAAEIYDLKNLRTPISGGLSKWATKDLPASPGVDGTSATDLSCQIDIEASGNCSLSCNWAPGAKAPADTEYNLYCGYNDNIDQCTSYIMEPGGQRRTGGHFPHIGIFANTLTRIVIRVNGTSKSLNIKAMEKIFMSSTIEKIPPVQNLTVDVSGLHWTKPVQTLSEMCFKYEVNISSMGRNKQITVSQLIFKDFRQHSAGRQLIRVRAVGQPPCWSNSLYSPWTEMTIIGEAIHRSDTTGIIVSVCVTTAFIIALLLCISCWRLLFPEIPKPKNDLKEAFKNIQNQALMRYNSWDNEEVISYIEEMGPSDKYRASTDYSHIADYSSSRFCKPL